MFFVNIAYYSFGSFFSHYSELESEKKLPWDLLKEILHHGKLNQRIADINAENVDELLYIAKKHHVKKLTEAVKKFQNKQDVDGIPMNLI